MVGCTISYLIAGLKSYIHQQDCFHLLAIRCHKCGQQCRRLFSPPGDDDGVVTVKLAGSPCTARISGFSEFGFKNIEY